MFRRYLAFLEGPGASSDSGGETGTANLAWMCQTAVADTGDMSVDKLSRWLGFVQGVLAAAGSISVAEERDVSRPLFHAAYRQDGVAVPATLGRIPGKA